MSVQVLIATMNQVDHSLLDKMNINSDAIVGNQCDRYSVESFENNGHSYLFLNCKEKGVGLNRNNALMHATADICIFADDDMVFFDGYEKKVEKLFLDNPKADVLIFNIEEKGDTDRRKNSKVKRINLSNYLNYGAARIAFRREKVSYAAIYFNQNFGGGTRHSCGEDSLFLRDCLRAGLKIYSLPESIAFLDGERESSWFNGYNEKYFFDKGVFLALAHPFLCHFFSIYLVIKHKEWRVNGLNPYKEIRRGIKFVKKNMYKG